MTGVHVSRDARFTWTVGVAAAVAACANAGDETSVNKPSATPPSVRTMLRNLTLHFAFCI